VGLSQRGSKVDPGHSFAAFDTLCVGFGPRTPPSTRSAKGKRYLLSVRRESMNSERSALDSNRWRSYSSAILSLPDWIKWDLTLSTCARTLHRFERVIFHVGRWFSIPLSRSPLCLPQMLWTKCCFAALRCSGMSLLSTGVRLQLMLSQRVALHNLPSPSRLHPKTAICSTCRAPGVCPLQIQDLSYRSDQIDGWCDCWRPPIEV